VLQGAGGIAAGVAPAPTRFAEDTSGSRQHRILNIDFRRTSEGAGNVVIDLADNNTGIDVRQQGRNIVVEFQRTQMPQHLQRRLDVTDFSTPVQFINAQQSGDMVRLEIQPRGQWEQSAYQADNRFILEVKPVIEDPTRLGGGQRRYTGDKLSLNFQNVEVRAVLQVLADFTGLNTITSDRWRSMAATCTRLRATSVFPEGATFESRDSTCAICDLRERAGSEVVTFSSNTIRPQGSCWCTISQQRAAASEIE
jgi:type IV pilus assembly protein PilQ